MTDLSVEEWPGTVIAVNVGGALIPTLVSPYLLTKTRMYFRDPLGAGIVARSCALCHGATVWAVAPAEVPDHSPVAAVYWLDPGQRSSKTVIAAVP